MPHEIESEFKFNITLGYLISLTERAPDFLKPYEYILSMIESLDPTDESLNLYNKITINWIKACVRVAEKENIFSKQVPWVCMENRPLVRGLYREAENHWKNNEFKKAYELFSKILKTNENDNIGARYSVKATAEKITFDDFEKQFTILHKDGSSYYNSDELFKWFSK